MARIKLGKIDQVKFLQKAYELSKPQGLGFLHFEPGGLSDSEAQKFVKMCSDARGVNYDYVNGRSMKLHIDIENGESFIQDSWYDHTGSQLRELVASVGVSLIEKEKEHGVSCNCNECRDKRGEGPDRLPWV
jgi:hypothetical protein